MKSVPVGDEGDVEHAVFPESERVPDDHLYGPRPEMFGQLAPGEIDWELVMPGISEITSAA